MYWRKLVVKIPIKATIRVALKKRGLYTGAVRNMTNIELWNQTTCVRDAAKHYTANGISVVPLQCGGKHLDFGLLSSSLDQKLKNPFRSYLKKPAADEELDRWFASNNGNIGILGGYKRIIILDFDDNMLFEKWKASNPAIASNTVVQETRRGKHVFLRFRKNSISEIFWRYNYFYSNFRVPGACNHKSEPGQIIWRGSYVVAWPSHTAKHGFDYRWAEGCSPFEKRIFEIGSLKDAGIEAENVLRKKILTFLLDWFREPSKNLAYLYVVYSRAVGRKNYTTFDNLRENIGEDTRSSDEFREDNSDLQGHNHKN